MIVRCPVPSATSFPSGRPRKFPRRSRAALLTSVSRMIKYIMHHMLVFVVVIQNMTRGSAANDTDDRGRGLFGWSHLARNCLETVKDDKTSMVRALQLLTTIPFATRVIEDGILSTGHGRLLDDTLIVRRVHGNVDWKSGQYNLRSEPAITFNR